MSAAQCGKWSETLYDMVTGNARALALRFSRPTINGPELGSSEVLVMIGGLDTNVRLESGSRCSRADE